LLTAILLKFSAFANPISISGSEAALALLIIVAIVKTYKTKDYSVFKKSFFVFFILMIVMETVSTFHGVDVARSLKHYTSFWVLLYLPVVYVVFEGKDKVEILMYLFAGCSLSSVVGIYELLAGKVQRVDGLLSHSLTYGNVTAIVCITAVGVLLFRMYETKKHLYITIFALIICFTGLILSGSRGPILSFFIGVFAMSVYCFRLKGFIAGLVMVVVMCGIVYSVPSVNERFMSTIKNIHNTKSSMGTRLVLWEASSKAIMMRPFFGYGKGNFKKEVSKYINVPTSSRAHAHNSYIQFTFLHGFFGLFAMLGFIGSIMWEIIRRRRGAPFIKAAIFIMIVFLLEGLTENTFGDSEVVMTCLSVIGLALAPGRPAINMKEDFTESV